MRTHNQRTEIRLNIFDRIVGWDGADMDDWNKWDRSTILETIDAITIVSDVDAGRIADAIIECSNSENAMICGPASIEAYDIREALKED